MKMKQFAFWEVEAGSGFWMLYDSLEDAVSQKGDGCKVYLIEPKLLGTFKREVRLVKEKKRKKK